MNYCTLNTLKRYLDMLCREQPEYANLHTIWQLNKRSYSDVLQR